MSKKIDILFVLPSLKPGGAERVVSFLAEALHKNKLKVILLVIGYEKDKSYETGSLKIVYLNKNRLLSSVYDIFKFIKKSKPKVVFSSIGHINIFMGLLSYFLKKIRFIAREASVISFRSKYGGGYKSWFLNSLRGIAYKNLDALVCQSADMKNDLMQNYKINSSKMYVIGNPITRLFKQLNKKLNREDKKIKFITVGRLTEVKGYSRIITGLSQISNYDFHYTVVGDGKLKNQIRNQIKNYNLSDKVTFINHTSSVLEEILKNDYFIQGSFVEGFPNAVLESCSVGVPVLAFNCPGGTKDIIQNNLNGFLVTSQVEFESLLINLNKKKQINKDLIIDSVMDKFDSKFIIEKYYKLFFKFLNEN